MIVVLCNSGIGFPNGLAPTARVTAYARGLVQNGCRVLVLCLDTSERHDVPLSNRAVSGTVGGIDFEYTPGRTLRGANVLRRRWLPIKGRLVAAQRILARQRHEQVEAILLYPDSAGAGVLFWLVARLCGATYLLGKSELPAVHARNSRLAMLLLPLYVRVAYRLFDGIIVVSEYLRHYFTPFIRRDAALLKIPINVDICEFAVAANEAQSGKYIAYCGTLNEAKDGVLSLLRAFALTVKDFPDVKLYLVGDSDAASQVPQYKRFAAELHIADRVVFTGTVPRERVPGYLAGAYALALARPSSQQAQSGFPTKLGEYLAAGRPVVITKTGEIEHYLRDGESAFMAPADDVSAFAARLHYVLSNPAEAARVGEAGRDVARRYFDFRDNAAMVKSFVAVCRRNHA